MTHRTLTVALVGNPNSGKSTLFNAITGLRQHVGNYPGVTVELKKGTATIGNDTLHLVDLPGTYSLAAHSPDEMVTVDYILGHQPSEPRPDVVVSIVDASNLDRHLYLTTQLLSLGVPVVLAVNLIDVADKQGLKIDYEQMGRQLGIPVVPIQANRGTGIDRLKQEIIAASLRSACVVPATGVPTQERGNEKNGVSCSCPVFPEAFQREAIALARQLPGIEPFVVQRLLIDIGGYTEQILTKRFGPIQEQVNSARQRLHDAGCGVPAIEARTRYSWIRQAMTGCVVRPASRPVNFSDRLDRFLTHKIWGTLLFLGLMFLVFEAIFVGAAPVMSQIDAAKEWLAKHVKAAMIPGPLRSLLADGAIKGVGAIIVFVPQILILFAFIAVLEDCGYMARAAFLMDRIMSKCGLNGKSFIPLLSSVACAVPGIMATRVIENRRDRLATILVAPLMSCSARLPLYALLIGVFLSDPWWLPGVALFGMYMIGLIVAPLVALTLKRTLLRGATPPFVMELPSFKWPQAKTVVRRMTGAGWAFIRRAGTFILATMVLIWTLQYFPTSRAGSDVTFEKEIEAIDKTVDDKKAELEALEKQEPPLTEEIEAKKKEIDDLKTKSDEINGEWKRQSYLGRAGRAMEPVFAPLGWDWRIGMAALASFPAREVIVSTLGMIYNQGDVDPKSIRESKNPGDTPLGKSIRQEWSEETGSPRASQPRLVALSILVFFALCCQCVSTLAVIRRETNSWWWPIFTFVYMTVLAYVAALGVYQIGRLFG